ncbi:MAG: cytochrome c [Nitrospirae bacterium]|nr:cytochrome c [Nitrospirota bacterium]
MKNNRLLIIAVILIALGLIGIFMSTWFKSYRGPRGMFQMPGKMMDGMMGGRMMNRDEMKDMMQRMMPGMLPPGIKPENLPDPESRGARLLTHYCNQCHNLPSPKMHTAEEWSSVTGRMFTRMSMMSGMMGIENPSFEEQHLIISYLKAHSLKSVSPGTLPSPESKGAILFKETCSQCHALPDPAIHTAQEWNAVVERMRGHMQAMGRRVITDQERTEIVAYLSNNARK